MKLTPTLHLPVATRDKGRDSTTLCCLSESETCICPRRLHIWNRALVGLYGGEYAHRLLTFVVLFCFRMYRTMIVSRLRGRSLIVCYSFLIKGVPKIGTVLSEISYINDAWWDLLLSTALVYNSNSNSKWISWGLNGWDWIPNRLKGHDFLIMSRCPLFSGYLTLKFFSFS
jgi:hypothetical protein